MSAHLYIVKHDFDGEQFISPCVGDEELRVHIEMAEHFGAMLSGITDIECELSNFVWDCCVEGLIQGWGHA